MSVPTVLQMEAVECGAASLAMILAYHGCYLPLEELRAVCGVSRDGSKASNVLKAARSYGLIAQGYKREPEQLRQMMMPVIIHWNLNHFVVLEGFRKNCALLNDPARGPSTCTLEEFDESFTGIVLVFKPGPDFRPAGGRPSLARSLLPRLSGSHAALAFIVLAGLTLVLPGILAASFSRIYVDNVIVKGFDDMASPVFLLMGATALVQGTLFWLQRHHLLRLEMKLALKMSGHFFWHVLRLPYTFFQQRYPGDIASRVGLNDRVARLLSAELASTLLDIMLIVFYGVLMVQYDVVLASIGVATALINMAVLRYTARRRLDLNQRMLQEQSKLVGTSMGGMQIIETLKATGSESDFFTRWAGYMTRQLNTVSDIAAVSRLLRAVPPLLLSLSTALVLGIGGLRIIDGRLSIGMLLAFQALMLAFLTPVARMVNLGSTLQEAKGGLVRLDDVLRATTDANAALPAMRSEGERPDPMAKLTGEVELRNISFGYSPLEPPLTKDFSLRLKPGGRVALVGKSGSGKSTIARMVTGLFEPWEGEIVFDGKPRSAYPREVLTNSLAVVDQEIFLFEGTVHDNITLWDPTVPERDVVRAGRDASIHEEISARVGGYGSRVEERGANFSGGQRQRLEIARALANNPAILVLDEATSALDPATEKRIDDNLRRRGCTCIIVAHRLSTIRDCDEIIVMDNGEIVQRGKHDDLKNIPGLYRDLISAE